MRSPDATESDFISLFVVLLLIVDSDDNIYNNDWMDHIFIFDSVI